MFSKIHWRSHLGLKVFMFSLVFRFGHCCVCWGGKILNIESFSLIYRTTQIFYFFSWSFDKLCFYKNLSKISTLLSMLLIKSSRIFNVNKIDGNAPFQSWYWLFSPMICYFCSSLQRMSVWLWCSPQYMFGFYFIHFSFFIISFLPLSYGFI